MRRLSHCSARGVNIPLWIVFEACDQPIHNKQPIPNSPTLQNIGIWIQHYYSTTSYVRVPIYEVIQKRKELHAGPLPYSF